MNTTIIASRFDIDKLYLEWLKGKSLRRLGKEIGLSRTTLMHRFRKKYGENATSRSHTALAKSILEDYPNYPDVELVALEALSVEGTFYSRHSIEMLSEYQCLHDTTLMDTLATHEEPEEETRLLLPYFVLFVNSITEVLKEVYVRAKNAVTVTAS